MKNTVVVGAGVMGTAFCKPLSDRGMQVHLVGTHLDRQIVSAMQETRVHPRLKAEIGENTNVYQDTDMAAAFAKGSDLVVGGVSTPGIDWITDRFAEHLNGSAPVIMLTKGIGRREDRIEILPDTISGRLKSAGVAHGPIGAVGGPCIAGELAVGHQTSAIIGFYDGDLARELSQAISTGYYHLASTDDLVGLEICAALKNFYTIGISTAAGRADMEKAVNGAGQNNALASLFNQAVLELRKIIGVCGGNNETALGLAGLGDLHVTCQAGRNSKLGRLIGKGMLYRDAMAGPLKGETVEGTLVAESLGAPLHGLISAGWIEAEEVPLALAIIDAVENNAAFSPDLAPYHKT